MCTDINGLEPTLIHHRFSRRYNYDTELQTKYGKFKPERLLHKKGGVFKMVSIIKIMVNTIWIEREISEEIHLENFCLLLKNVWKWIELSVTCFQAKKEIIKK